MDKQSPAPAADRGHAEVVVLASAQHDDGAAR